ncbi:MAG: hypothetical protein QW478_02540 [Candidatus Micrarchaeaceae archaeon]
MGRSLCNLPRSVTATNNLQLLYNFNLSTSVLQGSILKDFPYTIQFEQNKQNNISAFNDHIEISIPEIVQTINIDIIFNFASIGNPNIVIIFGGNIYSLYIDNGIAKGSLTKRLPPGLYKLYILSDTSMTIKNNFNNILINFTS